MSPKQACRLLSDMRLGLQTGAQQSHWPRAVMCTPLFGSAVARRACLSRRTCFGVVVRSGRVSGISRPVPCRGGPPTSCRRRRPPRVRPAPGPVLVHCGARQAAICLRLMNFDSSPPQDPLLPAERALAAVLASAPHHSSLPRPVRSSTARTRVRVSLEGSRPAARSSQQQQHAAARRCTQPAMIAIAAGLEAKLH